MTDLPKDTLSTLRAKIDQQRTTVEKLKRDGHECADAERQLRAMEAELSRGEAPPEARDNAGVGRLVNRRA